MTLSYDILEAQERFFRLAEREGYTIKRLSLDSSIPETTLRSYKGTHGAQVKMPLEAMLKLHGAVPLALLSLLTEPVGMVLCPQPEDWCPDRHAEACGDYRDAYIRARHPDSECGSDIGPNERIELKRRAANG